MRCSLFVCLLALALAPPSVSAHEDSPLGEAMHVLKDAFKPLYRGLTTEPDTDKMEQYLAWTRTIKEEAGKAREHAPSMTKEMSEADRATLVKNYTEDMDAFIQQVDALEKALAAGNLPQAQVLVKKLRAAQKDGHDKYQEEEE